MPESRNSTQPENLPEAVAAPHYTRLDERALEELLSQLGVIVPGERDCFHQLCRMWAEEIPYRRFLVTMGDELGLETELARLMRRLTQREYGLLQTHIQDSKIVHRAIILCEPGSVRFFSYLIDEQYREFDLSLDAPLPTVKRLKADEIVIPTDFYRELDESTMFQLVHEPKEFPRFTVFRYRFGSGDALPIPRVRAEGFERLLMRKVARRLEATEFAVAVSRVVGTSLNELHRHSTGTGAIFWLGFCSTVRSELEKLRDLTGLRVDDDFFYCCELIERYLRASTLKEDEERKERERRLADWKALAQTLRSTEQALQTEAEFSALVDGYQRDYPVGFDEFKAGLQENYCTPPEGKQVARMNSIAGYYVHRDRVYEAFRERIVPVRNGLRREYIALMDFQLQGKRGDYSAFLGKENLELDIAERLRSIDPYCAAVLSNPEFLAEAIAHFVKTSGKQLDIERVRAIMSAYFKPGTMHLQELAVIFEIALFEVYDSVAPRLPWLLRLWFRVTGKGTDLRNTYISRSVIAPNGVSAGIQLSARGGGRKVRGAVGRSAKSGGFLEGLGLTRPRGDAQGQSSPRGSSGSVAGSVAGSSPGSLADGGGGQRAGRSGSGSSRSSAPRPERRYSRQELDSAWDEFKRSLKG